MQRRQEIAATMAFARKRRGGSVPRPEAREQMEAYAKRMRDIKANGGKSTRKKKKKGGNKKRKRE